jgi:GT2 family glycosyltransferase
MCSPEPPPTDNPIPPLVYIIVLNWNGHDETLHCIKSLGQQAYPNFRILVIDNGSTDGSTQLLRELGGHISLIESRDNLGYAGGNNLAMREAFGRGADYVWLFNSDAMAAPETLSRMIEVCEADRAIGLASPLIREEDDRIQFAGRIFDLTVPDTTSTEDVGLARAWQANHPDRIAVTGTAMLVSRALYERIGGLDDSLFAYWEDTDYSIRSASAGFRNVVAFDTAIFHPGKPTIATPNAVRPHYYYFMARNELLLWRKCCSRMRFLKSAVWVLRHRLLQIGRMPDNQSGIDAILAGLWDGYRGVGGRYDKARRMPFPFGCLLSRYPRFWIRAIDTISQ